MPTVPNLAPSTKRQVACALGLIALLSVSVPVRPARAAGQQIAVAGRPSDTDVARPAPLMRIADIRATDRSAFGQHAAVTGVVTYFDRGWDLLFVQDASAGIFVFMDGVDQSVEVGDLVR